MSSPRNRLFLMMVLEIAIWGAWQIKIFSYMTMLGFTAGQQALVASVFGIASLVGIFFSNQFADRNFAAERFLAFSHLVGGLALFATAFTTHFGPFFAFFLLYGLLYVPTIFRATSSQWLWTTRRWASPKWSAAQTSSDQLSASCFSIARSV